jgi:hypothetical protein
MNATATFSLAFYSRKASKTRLKQICHADMRLPASRERFATARLQRSPTRRCGPVVDFVPDLLNALEKEDAWATR